MILGKTTRTPASTIWKVEVTDWVEPAFSMLPESNFFRASSVFSTFHWLRIPFGRNAVKLPSCNVPFTNLCGAAVRTSSDLVFACAFSFTFGKWK